MIEIEITGRPATKGSMAVGRNGRIFHVAGSALAAWEKSARLAAVRALAAPDGAPLPLYPSGPVAVALWLALPRPKRAAADAVPAQQRYDVDKFARATLDAWTGTVYLDDGQVTELYVAKAYAQAESPPGARALIARPGDAEWTTALAESLRAESLPRLL